MQTWLENYKWQRSGFEKKNSKIVGQNAAYGRPEQKHGCASKYS